MNPPFLLSFSPKRPWEPRSAHDGQARASSSDCPSCSQQRPMVTASQCQAIASSPEGSPTKHKPSNCMHSLPTGPPQILGLLRYMPPLLLL